MEKLVDCQSTLKAPFTKNMAVQDFTISLPLSVLLSSVETHVEKKDFSWFCPSEHLGKLG